MNCFGPGEVRRTADVDVDVELGPGIDSRSERRLRFAASGMAMMLTPLLASHHIFSEDARSLHEMVDSLKQ